jgi:Flp pilus assembly protein TadD
MNAQLVYGPTDRHLWAKSYERDLRDALMLQDELAEAIASEVRVAAKPRPRSHDAIEGPANLAPRKLYLRELYLRGRHSELSRSLAGVQTAKEYYRRAIEQDSTYAAGFAGLAGAYGLAAIYGYGPARPALDSARMMARRAFALDSTLPESRTALGITLADAGEFAPAEREFRRAIELGPSDAQAHFQYSMLLVALGRGREALEEADRAAELDPLAPRGVVMMQRNAHYLITGERPFLKLAPGSRQSSILKLPGEPWARRANAYDLAEAGKCAEARAEIEPAQQLAPGTVQMLVALSMIEWWCGDRQRARTLLAEIKRRADARDQASHIAIAHTLFGEPDSAFVWLGHQRWTMSKLTDLRAVRWLDPLRSDPRYAELLIRLELNAPVRTDTARRSDPDGARSRQPGLRSRSSSASLDSPRDSPS